MSMIPWKEVGNSPTYQCIKSSWNDLINDKEKTELDYLAFLRDHSVFFSRRMHWRESVLISELRLGPNFRVDFVLAGSERSLGCKYILIEVESPHTPAFTKKGTPSARLNTAMQQIRDWKNWISSNNEECRRIFPSWDKLFQYMIIIGRDTDPHIEKRNQITKEGDVTIRSFDYVTDLINNTPFHDFLEPSYETSPLPKEKDNEFSNPFCKAFSDVHWREAIKNPRFKTWHIFSNNIDDFLAQREYNKDRLEEFKLYLQSLPPERVTVGNGL